jgi:hypothetical protein
MYRKRDQNWPKKALLGQNSTWGIKKRRIKRYLLLKKKFATFLPKKGLSVPKKD